MCALLEAPPHSVLPTYSLPLRRPKASLPGGSANRSARLAVCTAAAARRLPPPPQHSIHTGRRLPYTPGSLAGMEPGRSAHRKVGHHQEPDHCHRDHRCRDHHQRPLSSRSRPSVRQHRCKQRSSIWPAINRESIFGELICETRGPRL
jgi:hypothetical protein